MSDINFVNTDTKEIYNDLINKFEEGIGETLYPGDERLIFLQQLMSLIVATKNNINDSAKQNLLRYARNEKLDTLGEDLYFTKRLEATKANCLCKCTLSKKQDNDTIIPAGTRVTPDGIIYFKLRADVIILSGQLESTGILDAEKVGTKYNGFSVGQIKNIVDLLPFLEKVENTTIPVGGSDIEDDDSYRDRCRLSKESKSVAGPDDAYVFFAKESHASIQDATVSSPSPGSVKITVLLEDGKEANDEILNTVLENCSRKDRRPLTDKVEVVSAEEISYDINLTYYLDKNHVTEEMNYRRKIEGINLDLKDGAILDYISWQRYNLGNDINPDELRYRIQDGATYNTLDGKKFTAVRKIELVNPTHLELTDIQVAKIRNVNVSYGGLE